MAFLQPEPIRLTKPERRDLQSLVRQQTCPQHLALRARIILLADEGLGVRPTAEQLEVARSTVQMWRRRWRCRSGDSVAECLADAPRSGAPAKFSAAEVSAIMALADEPPRKNGFAATRWTQQELANEAMARGIVKSISQRSVGRLLKKR